MSIKKEPIKAKKVIKPSQTINKKPKKITVEKVINDYVENSHKPLFSIVLIAKNESKTLPRCLDSLSEFTKRGGEIVLLDTGSTDNTLEIATSYGCKTATLNCMMQIDVVTCEKINEKFVKNNEEPIMPMNGTSIFNFSYARNMANAMASNDFVISLDADEMYSQFDIDSVNALIKNGADQLEYQFVFSHHADGTANMQFKQSKAFNRFKFKWVGIIHEVLSGTGNTVYANESIIKLEHFQEPTKEHRGKYMIGLAYDCYMNPNNDRHSHYLGRELMWTNRNISAIEEFKRHLSMNSAWQPERAQSNTYIGQCYGKLNDFENEITYYNKAFFIDSTRREPLMFAMDTFIRNKNYMAAICYGKAALEIPITDYYATHIPHYQEEPHKMLYLAYGYNGDMVNAKKQIKIALEYAPNNSEILSHYQFYNTLPTISVIIPHISGQREEGLQKCVDSILRQNYPQNLIDIKIIGGDETVPQKVDEGVKQTNGQMIVFAANDMEFHHDDFIKAVICGEQESKALVVFETGIRNSDGYICEHFMINRNFISKLSFGQIFDTAFHHCGSDDWLWIQSDKLNQATIAIHTKTKHYHFSRGGVYDSTYEKGWSKVNEDRKILKQKKQLQLN